MQPPQERSLLNRIFISPDEPRLRSGWRLTGQTILFFIFLFIFILPFSIILFLIPIDWLIDLVGDIAGEVDLLISAGAQLVAVTLSVFVARRFLDRRSNTSLGLWLNWRGLADLVAGILIAGVSIGLIFFIQRGAGWLTITGYGWKTLSASQIILRVLILFFFTVCIGWAEELLFRGYWLQNLSQGLNLFWGVLLSSLAFALAHLANPGISLAAVVGLTLAGFLFAFSLLRSGGLWLPIGIHIGWNFFEGPVFGFEVSGLEAFRLLVIQQVAGPELITGGSFGPEAGLVLLPALLAAAALIYLYTLKRPVNGELEL